MGPFIHDEQQLRIAFSKYGHIASCFVPKDEQGHSKGYGFVCFSSHEEAARAIQEMSGFVHPPLYVGFFQPKEERRAQLDVQYRQSQPFQVGEISIILYVQRSKSEGMCSEALTQSMIGYNNVTIPVFIDVYLLADTAEPAC